MTATFQSSILSSNIYNSSRKSRRSSKRFFQVDIENFDNEIESLEVYAQSYSEAAQEAQAIYSGDIYNMNIYEIC